LFHRETARVMVDLLALFSLRTAENSARAARERVANVPVAFQHQAQIMKAVETGYLVVSLAVCWLSY